MVVEGMFLSRTMTTRERETLELCQKVLTVLHVWTMAADLQLETQLARLRDPSRDLQGAKFCLQLVQSLAIGVTSWALCARPDISTYSAATLQFDREERREVNSLLQKT